MSLLKRFILVNVFFVIPFFALNGQGNFHDTLILKNNDSGYQKEYYNLRPYLKVLPDSFSEYSIDYVASRDMEGAFFKDSTRILDGIGFGRKINTYWVKLNIRSELKKHHRWLLNFSADKVDYYFNSEDSSAFEFFHSGTQVPFNQRHFKNIYGNLSCFPIGISPGTVQTIYFKISGMYLNNVFHQAMFSPEFFNTYERPLFASKMIFYGILLAMSIYHILIFLYQRKVVYLHFSLFLLTIAIMEAMYSGNFCEFLFPSRERGINFFPFMWVLYFSFFYLFSRSYLKLKSLLPRIDLIWKIGLTVYIILASTKVIMFNLAGGLIFIDTKLFSLISSFNYILEIFFLLISIISGVLTLRKGYKPAKVYLIATSFYVVFTFILFFQPLTGIVILPFNIFIGLDELIMVLIFSVGTARQIKELEVEKIKAELDREKEHAKAEKAIALNAFKTKFFTNITHEFRTPLTVILGMADLIKEQPTSWYNKGSQLIKQNGQRLLNLINQILDLSKLEAGAMPVNYIQADIIKFLKFLMESIRSMAAQKDIQLLFKADREHLVMDFDPDKVSTIFSNLVTNSIKFTPKNGKVMINLTATGDPVQKFEIAIIDNGQGIPKEEMDQIFDRFFEGPDLNNLSKGTGVGLSLTKEMVHLLKGQIIAENLPEKGAKFTVVLPISNNARISDVLHEFKQANTSKRKIGKESKALTKPTILIVEDSKEVAEYINALLVNRYDLTWAENGILGLEYAQTFIPDLIISDVMMPKMDGFEMTRKLKTDRRTSHIPIVLLTAKADKSSRLQGLETGADAYLSKPFDKSELAIRINKLITLRNTLQKRYRDFAFIFDAEKTAGHDKAQFEDSFIEELQAEIEENISDPDYGIDDLCKSLSMSRAQLYRKFKALTRYSIGDFIRKIRLHKARHLLTSTHLNVSQIAFEVGFKNPTSFSRSFISEFGIKPSDIRKKMYRQVH